MRQFTEVIKAIVKGDYASLSYFYSHINSNRARASGNFPVFSQAEHALSPLTHEQHIFTSVKEKRCSQRGNR